MYYSIYTFTFASISIVTTYITIFIINSGYLYKYDEWENIVVVIGVIVVALHNYVE